VDTRGLHISSREMSEGSEGLVATQKHSVDFSEINQTLEEQDCHFLDECWTISLTINLSRFRCCVLTYEPIRLIQTKLPPRSDFVLCNKLLQFHNVISVQTTVFASSGQ